MYGWALAAACFLGTATVQAQINDGGSIPLSLSSTLITKQLPVVTTPPLDMAKVLAEDVEEEKQGTFMRIGRTIPVNIDLRQAGAWEPMAGGGQLCRLRIESPDALGVNLYFSKFNLPNGAKLHVYTPDYKRILGGFTAANNHSSGLFATEHLDGDALIVEYYEPAWAAGTGELVIGEVGHMYKTGGFGSSDNCQVNVNCSPEGTGKTQQRDAVARILVKVGAQQGYCSGTMINNVRQNCTPYFLTALHCGTTSSNVLTTAADLNQWIFYFNYQSVGCTNGSKPTPNTITGAVARANSGDGGGDTGSDFLLLELNSSPLQSWNVFYAGWNRNNTAITGGYGIHHPSGDIKKISHFTGTTASTSWGGTTANTHWQVIWTATTNGHGVTEGGSSGSALFNNSGLLVGTLTGGGSFCTATSSPDAYGKFSYHWDQNGTTADRRLKNWLDPDNTGATTLSGVYYPCVVNTNDAGISDITAPVDGQYLCTNPFTPQVVLKNYGTANLTSATIKYQINNNTPGTFSWTGTLASNATTTITLPNQTAPAGAFTFRAYTQLPNGLADPNPANDTTTVTTALDVSSVIPYAEPFNAGSMPTNIDVYDPDGDGFAWEHTTTATATGSGAGFGSALFDNYGGTSASNPGGTIDWMILPSLNFTGKTAVSMTFDVAYRRYNTTTNDTLIIAVSSNCSPTYTIVYKKGGASLATVTTTSTTAFVPTQAQWRTETINLGAYDNTDHISVAFINYSDWGQNLYVDNINITSACSMTASISNPTNVACFGNSTGSATVTPTGGTTPYTYAWSTGATTATATGLAAGTRTVTVTDAAGCTATASVSITQPSAALSATNTKTNVLCNGGSTGSITVTATGGTAPYSYNRGTGSQSSNVFNGLVAGSYTVTVTDANGCTTTTAASITQPTTLSATNTKTNVACNGGSTGSITVTATGGTSPYTYNRGTGSQSSNVFNGLTAGSYTVTITDANGCTATTAATITQPTALSATNSKTNVLCNGASTGSITVTATGGTSPYTYNRGTGSQSSNVFNGLAAGSYTVTVTDANGCTATTTASITQPTTITTNATANGESCAGNDGTATVTASGGTGTLTYLWSNGQTAATATGLTAGNYNFTVTDANGCQKTGSAIVPDNCNPCSITTTTSFNNPACNNDCNGTATITPTSGTAPYAFVWSNGSSSATASGLCAGSYSVTVSDAAGCTATGSFSLSNPTVVQATASTTQQVNCFGAATGAAQASATGGTGSYTFNWSNSATGASISNLSAATYTVTATDANGCSATAVTSVTQPTSAVDATATATNASCGGVADGSVTATATGGNSGYTFAWSNGGSGVTINNVVSGTYTVTVTDANGCTDVASATVGQNGGVIASISTTTNVLCHGASTGSATATGTGGTAPYMFDWSNGNSSATIVNIAAGSYTVTVTDAAGCVSTATATVNEPAAALAVSAAGTNPSGSSTNDGSVDLTVSGGTTPYSFDWDNGSNTEDLSGLGTGAYTVTVTDANGCTATATATLVIVGVEDIALVQQFQVMPNPNQGNFTIQIQLASNQAATVRLTDVLGRTLRQWEFQQPTIQIPVDVVEQADGVYFVNLITAEGQATIKVVVAK